MLVDMSNSHRLRLPGLILSVGAAACGSGGGKGGGGGSGGNSGACNAIANVGQVISKTATTDAYPDTPSFTGGAIADGTYALTAMLNYATASAPSGTRKETFLVAGNQLNAVFSVDGGAEERYTATLEMNTGTPYALTLNVSCTAPDVTGRSTTFYEATATDLRIGTDLMEISTYTKQ